MMDFAFHWYDIFLIVWFAFVMIVSRLKNYRHALMANITGAAFFTVYALLKHEPVAASMTAIAACSGLIQLLIPISNERKFVIARNTIALISALAACVLLYQKPADILPCMSTFLLRIGEAQQSAKILKMAMIAGAVMWGLFALMTGLYIMFAMEIVIIAVFVQKLLSDDKQSKVMPTE